MLLVAWLPMQTIVALVLYQYAGLTQDAARGVLLAKDVGVALLIAYLAVRHWRSLRLAWFDWMAIAYVVILFAYAIVPFALGTRLAPIAVVASLREFAVPVELYGLGRLAVVAGADRTLVLRAFLAVSLAAGTFTLITYLVLPATVWSSTLDLVTFIREVQGIPQAVNLWFISAVGSYGAAGGVVYPRAIGPFAHPVGTSHYYVLPLLLMAAAALERQSVGDRRRTALYIAAAALFGLAVIAPISRAAWIAVGLGLLLIGIQFRRVRLTLAGLAAAGLFIAVVPPFSYAIWSALTFQDSSTIAHQQEVQRGIEVLIANPFGLGVGQADYFGKWLGRGAEGAISEGVGENLYLSVLVTVGPLGLLAFAGWLLGLVRSLLRHATAERDWASLAVAAALIGLAVSAMTASPLMRFTTAGSFWALTGLLLSASPRARGAGGAIEGGSPRA